MWDAPGCRTPEGTVKHFLVVELVETLASSFLCSQALSQPALAVEPVETSRRLLPFVDAEMIDSLTYHLNQQRSIMRLGEEVDMIEPVANDHGERVKIHLVSGKPITTDMALYSIGCTGATRSLNIEAASLETDERGPLKVNQHSQTNIPDIYAVGDVIGFPSLASTSMEQGRLAACHAFGIPTQHTPELFPYGIYTIPEISTVGRSEEELTEQGFHTRSARRNTARSPADKSSAINQDS